MNRTSTKTLYETELKINGTVLHILRSKRVLDKPIGTLSGLGHQRINSCSINDGRPTLFSILAKDYRNAYYQALRNYDLNVRSPCEVEIRTAKRANR